MPANIAARAIWCGSRCPALGKVVSWCTFEHDYYRGTLPIPYDTILVELAEGPLFVSNPADFGWQDIVADLPVKLAFIDCEDSGGPFRLPVFARA